MKNLPMCVFIGICVVMRGASEIINCYECDNCDVLDKSQLITCPLDYATNSPITNNPTTHFPESTTNPSEEPTASENTGSPLEVISTTVSPKPPQIVITDPTQTQEPVTESTGSPLEVISTTVSPKPPQIVITDPTQTQEPVTESTRSPLEVISTTVSPNLIPIVTDPPQTQEPVTETPKTTTAITQEIEPTKTTYQPITNEGKQTTVPRSSKTEIPTNGIPYSVETLGPFTNDPKPSATGSSESYNIEQTAPLLVITPVVTITDSSEAVTAAPEASAPMINLPPEAQAPSQSLKPETVNSFAPALMVQPSQYEQPYQIFNRMPRGIRNLRSAPSYHCYSINIHDGDSKKVKKGCVEVPEEKSACDVLKDKFGKSIDKCKICTVDKCNSCSTLKYSIITLVMVLVVSFY